VISVFRGSDYIEAHLLTGLLKQHGIDTFLQGALLQGGLGELPALGHLAIMVDEADRDAAKRVIAAYERGDLVIDDDHDGEPDSGSPGADENK
jgi:putative signal transducing protein